MNCIPLRCPPQLQNKYSIGGLVMNAANSNEAVVSPDEIRSIFSERMSQMYKDEVPQYSTLLDIVSGVNREVLDQDPALEICLKNNDDLARLSQEYHGAIRLGTATELSTMRRVFAVLGMDPVNYYDLSVAGIPVHATAFRPTTRASLSKNPFRVFTSLLRLELIDDPDLREVASQILSKRNIYTARALELLEIVEQRGGLDDRQAKEFVEEILETFRWHNEATVHAATYERLHSAHRLVADVVSFRGPHINHLTPRTLDIDKAQHEMPKRGVTPKNIIEGPPRRNVPILLRQTSFKALEETVSFQGASEEGTHTARFGEIEQRGIALTPKGMALYDRLLNQARASIGEEVDYDKVLSQVFSEFPDDLDEIRTKKLAYFKYRVAREDATGLSMNTDVEDLIKIGVIEVTPVLYEDFLPVSAAGIFQSNLGGTEQKAYASNAAKAEFERALGASVLESCELYTDIQEKSLNEVQLWILNCAAESVNA